MCLKIGVTGFLGREGRKGRGSGRTTPEGLADSALPSCAQAGSPQACCRHVQCLQRKADWRCAAEVGVTILKNVETAFWVSSLHILAVLQF